MNIIKANLKLFYQRRGLWVWYLVLFVFFQYFFMGSVTQESGGAANYVLISLFLGILIADLQRDVLAKPFSFCMPEHRNLLRHLVFGIGGIISLLLGMIFFGYHGLDLPYVLLVVLAAAFAGMVLYLVGVCLVLVSKTSVFGGLVLIMIFLTIQSGYMKPLEYLIVSVPLVPIALGILVCGITWQWLGRESLARKYSGESLVSFADSLNYARTQEFHQKKALQ